MVAMVLAQLCLFSWLSTGPTPTPEVTLEKHARFRCSAEALPRCRQGELYGVEGQRAVTPLCIRCSVATPVVKV